MKGKYITTSLILAILGNGRANCGIEVAETTANTKDHELIWSRETAMANEKILKAMGRDELKNA